MKKIYENAEIELIALTSADVVTASGVKNVSYNDDEGESGGSASFFSIFG